MRSHIAVLGFGLGVVASGCGFSSGGGGGGGGGPDACVSFASLLDTCQLAFDGDLMLSGSAIYDTTMHVLTVGGTEMPVAHTTVTIAGDEVDVISARSVRITASSSLRGVGIRPLAIIASDTLTVEVDAQIGVAEGGAGAQMACMNDAMPGQGSGTAANDGGAGGGGGGYGADGGDGGDGNVDATPTQGGVKGRGGAMPTGLRGGCPGAAGGDGDGPGGAGGAGGGALYVVAANQIELDASAPITAGGGRGRGGGLNAMGEGNAGGGGGGSGGMLILEAPHIAGANATITANGGGGGEGSDNTSAGDDGSPGSLTTDRTSGGAGDAAFGTDGGRGGSVNTPAGETVVDVLAGGGGGGGGGVGFIRILSTDVQGVTMSPAPSPEPP